MSDVLAAYDAFTALSPLQRSRPLDHHAIVVRSGPRRNVAELAARLGEVVAGCPAADERELRSAAPSAEADPEAVWIEQVPHLSDDPRAVRKLHQELLRPLPAHLPVPVRLVVLRYEDRDHLVFTAARTRLDRASLTSVAHAVIGDSEDPAHRLWWDLPTAGAAEGRPAADLRSTGDGAPSRAAHRFPTSTPAAGTSTSALRAAQLAAVACATMRYRDSTQAVVGVVRRRHRSASVLGAAEETVPLTLTATDATTVEDLLSQAQAALDGAAPRESPDGSEPAPPDVTVTFDDVHTDPHRDGDAAYFPGIRPTPRTVVHWSGEATGGHQAVCLFDESQDGRELAEQFCAHLAAVLRQLLEAPAATPVDRLRLFDDEQEAALRRLADGGALDGEPVAVHRAFQDIAAAQPDAPAVSHKQETLTYRQLEARANRFAHALRSLGVQTGDRVGVCVERSTDLVVTLLAVLKAGAAYVPMDPGYPAERLAYTADDAGLRLVIGPDDPSHPGVPGVHMVPAADLAQRARSQPDAPVSDTADPEQPAYVIYTSGTTGRPKGVVVPHRNVTALVEATRSDFALSPQDVWSQFHSVAFDFSVWEIWGCLLTGGRLVVVPYFSARSPEAFLELLVSEKVTVLNQTPSAFSELVRLHQQTTTHPPEGDPTGMPVSVRLLVFGGEPLDPRVLRPCLDADGWSTCRMVNMFGITETTVHVTAQTVTRREVLNGDRSVGRPLKGWNVSIRDSRGRLLPPGVRGEIHVGGAGVALGYLNRPELTGERFVADPYTDDRMYRSGDCGRLLPDGRIEHLGRLDSQVKIRGYRIETDEVRAVLLEDPALSDAIVVPGQDNAGGLRLDAYLIFRDGVRAEHSTAELRDRAAKILPPYMLPSTWTPISEIPRTINNKLDVGRLPAPQPAVPGRAAPSVRSTVPDGDEQSGELDLVCSIWSEVFGFTVGPDSDFFGIGGNSLLATRLSAAFRAKGLPSLQIRDLYRNPSPRGIAALLEA